MSEGSRDEGSHSPEEVVQLCLAGKRGEARYLWDWSVLAAASPGTRTSTAASDMAVMVEVDNLSGDYGRGKFGSRQSRYDIVPCKAVLPTTTTTTTC